jgi:hypothetical protein
VLDKLSEATKAWEDEFKARNSDGKSSLGGKGPAPSSKPKAPLQKFMIPLQQTPKEGDSLEFGKLKGPDKSTVELLQNVPGLEVHLVLIVKHESGVARMVPGFQQPEDDYDEYGNYAGAQLRDVEGMGEIYESYVHFENWVAETDLPRSAVAGEYWESKHDRRFHGLSVEG